MSHDGMQDAQETDKGLGYSIPAVPEVLRAQLFRGRPWLLAESGIRHSLGWQERREAGPGFVLVEMCRLGRVKVISRFSFTRQGWESGDCARTGRPGEPAEQLSKLSSLLADGVLSRDEFEHLPAKLPPEVRGRGDEPRGTVGTVRKQTGSMRLADNPSDFAGDLTTALARCGLVAAYLHGSAALGGWNERRSDVDMLFIADDGIDADSIAAIGEQLLAWAVYCPGQGLECSVVTASQAARPAAPFPFCLHSGTGADGQRLYLGTEVPGDADLLMHYEVCRTVGITLFGPPPADCIGAVPRQAVLGYLAGELKWGLANGMESYAVLNACRALEYLRSGRILSKVAGGLAALERGDAPADLVRQALDQQQAKSEERPPGPGAIAFVNGARLRLATAAEGAS